VDAVILVDNVSVRPGKGKSSAPVPFDISDDAKSILISVSRDSWPKAQKQNEDLPAPSVRVVLEVQRRGWEVEGFFESEGGDYFVRTGTGQTPDFRLAQVSSARIGLQPGKNRKGRIRIEAIEDISTTLKAENSVTVGTPGSTQGTSVSTLGVSVTVSGTNTWLKVGVGWSAGSPVGFSSCTYNGVATTSLWSTPTSLSYHRSVGRDLVAPASGTNTLTATLAGTQDEMCLGGIPFEGVDQTTPHGTVPTVATGTTGTPTVNVASATDEIVVDFAYGGFSDIAVGTGQTSRWEEEGIGSAPYLNSGGASTEAGATTVTMSWSGTAGDIPDWLTCGVSVKPAAAGGATVRSYLPTLGVS